MRVLYVIVALLLAAPAAAHQDTVAHSRMVIRENGEVDYALKIPVEDLAETLGHHSHTPLDAPQVRSAEERLFRHFLPLVGLTSGGEPCPVERRGLDVPEDERLYGELRMRFRCPAGAPVTLDYRVFFDIDPGHMGMLEVESAGGTTRAELIGERPRWEVDTSVAGPPQLRAVAGAAAPPLEKSRPVTAAKPISAELASSGEKAEQIAEPHAHRDPGVEEPTTTPRRPRRNWMLMAFVVSVAGAGAFLAMRVARRRAKLPSR